GRPVVLLRQARLDHADPARAVAISGFVLATPPGGPLAGGILDEVPVARLEDVERQPVPWQEQRSGQGEDGERRREEVVRCRCSHQSISDLSTAMKAACGTSTAPTIFMRFLPSFCFSSSLRLRVMSPPNHLPRTSLRRRRRFSRARPRAPPPAGS